MICWLGCLQHLDLSPGEARHSVHCLQALKVYMVVCRRSKCCRNMQALLWWPNKNIEPELSLSSACAVTRQTCHILSHSTILQT
jgi:hypothetical protein